MQPHHPRLGTPLSSLREFYFEGGGVIGKASLREGPYGCDHDFLNSQAA